MNNKIWEKPKLLVLARMEPDEAVLQNCKVDTSTVGPGKGGDPNCSYPQGDDMNHCAHLAAS